MTTEEPNVETIKESIMKFLATQPDDITIEEIMDYLFLKQEIIKGKQALREGHYYTHEQAKEILKEWLE